MNSKTIRHTIAAGSMMAAFFVVSACGADVSPPAQDINVDRSGDTGNGVTTGDNKQPPDSRP